MDITKYRWHISSINFFLKFKGGIYLDYKVGIYTQIE